MDIGVAETDEQRESTFRVLNDEISEQHRILMQEAAPVFVVELIVGSKVAIYQRNVATVRGRVVAWSVSAALLLVSSVLSVLTAITETLR